MTRALKLLWTCALPCAAVLVAACSPPPKPPPPDAGPDTACGLDCDAQRRYGLLVNRCFEYSASLQPATPADLGVQVTRLFDLEGGVKTLEVEYTQSGQVLMTDYFVLTAGELRLARRTFLPGQSVTYKDASGAIVGVSWLKAATASGESFSSTASADVVVGQRRTEDTILTVTTAEATVSEQTVPLKKFDEAFKLILAETPNHGTDPRRVFAPATGFTLFSTYFSPTNAGSPREYRLQRVRELGTPDAGTDPCGFGHP